MALLEGVLVYEDLANVDLEIEAIFENMELKQQIFAKLNDGSRLSKMMSRGKRSECPHW